MNDQTDKDVERIARIEDAWDRAKDKVKSKQFLKFVAPPAYLHHDKCPHCGCSIFKDIRKRLPSE